MKNSPSEYWVLVADSGCARIFELPQKPDKFREVQELVSESRHQPSRELVSDASGRVVNVQGGKASHSMDPRSNAHDLAEQAFSKELVKTLEKAANRNVFEHLAIVADPKTLGRMRQQMSKTLSARLTNELNRDLVGMPLDALEKKVRAELGWQERQ